MSSVRPIDAPNGEVARALDFYALKSECVPLFLAEMAFES